MISRLLVRGNWSPARRSGTVKGRPKARGAPTGAQRRSSGPAVEPLLVQNQAVAVHTILSLSFHPDYTQPGESCQIACSRAGGRRTAWSSARPSPRATNGALAGQSSHTSPRDRPVGQPGKRVRDALRQVVPGYRSRSQKTVPHPDGRPKRNGYTVARRAPRRSSTRTAWADRCGGPGRKRISRQTRAIATRQ